jgi:DNA-binding PadR family transcriptional regulator
LTTISVDGISFSDIPKGVIATNDIINGKGPSMNETEDRADELIPLTETTFLTLLALLKPCHGYEIMQVSSRLSGGRVKIGPGTLYGALNVLAKQGLIERRGEMEAEGERRKIYGLTPLGEEVVRRECARLEGLAAAARAALDGTGLARKEIDDAR